MIIAIVATAAVVILTVVVWFLLVELKKCRDKEMKRALLLKKYGAEHIKETVRNEVKAQRELLALIYSTCDNFYKHKETIIEKLSQLHSQGSIQSLSSNVVHLANLAENSALYSMAEEYSLTDKELRTCCYIHLGFKWQEICTAESLAENAYNVRCSRIRKKLGLSKEERIPDFISNYCNRINSSAQ